MHLYYVCVFYLIRKDAQLYIEQILKIPNCTLKLSSFDPEKNSLLDFDANLLSDLSVKIKLDSHFKKNKISHYILVDHIIHDEKKIDFSSDIVENTLYMIQENGKTYRWPKVKVVFIRMSNENLATCIMSNQNAFPFNRRDTFRIPVDQDGLVYWDEDETPEKCTIRDISHDGIGISLPKTSRKLLKGLPAKIIWEETANFDNNRSSTRKYTVQARIIRRQTRLENEIRIGLQMSNEPDAIRDYIQWAQTHRGFSKENEKPTMHKGVAKAESWKVKKELNKMSGIEEE